MSALVLLTGACGSDDKSATETPSSTKARVSTTVDQVPAARPLAEFTGPGDKTTDTFKAAANWAIEWQVPAGKGFSVELLTPDGLSKGQILEAGDKTTGTTYVSDAGEFKLKVSAGGDWSIKIIGSTP